MGEKLKDSLSVTLNTFKNFLFLLWDRLETFYYFIVRKCSDILSFFKVKINRTRLFSKFSYSYPFDIVDDLPQMVFTIFKEFYEKGQIDIVDWNSDDEHIKIKQNMNNIYNYIVVERQKILNKIDLIDLQLSDIKFKSKCKKNISIYYKLSNDFYKKDNIYCKKIIDIRNYLWT